MINLCCSDDVHDELDDDDDPTCLLLDTPTVSVVALKLFIAAQLITVEAHLRFEKDDCNFILATSWLSFNDDDGDKSRTIKNCQSKAYIIPGRHSEVFFPHFLLRGQMILNKNFNEQWAWGLHMNLYVQQSDFTTNHCLLLLELPTFARATAPHSYHIE